MLYVLGGHSLLDAVRRGLGGKPPWPLGRVRAHKTSVVGGAYLGLHLSRVETMGYFAILLAGKIDDARA